MKASEVLRKARALLAKKGGWTQRVAARNRAGRSILPERPSACCFCALGAIRHVEKEREYAWTARKLLAQAAGARGSVFVADWNDAPKRKKSEVLAAFTKAIKLAKEAGE